DVGQAQMDLLGAEGDRSEPHDSDHEVADPEQSRAPAARRPLRRGTGAGLLVLVVAHVRPNPIPIVPGPVPVAPSGAGIAFVAARRALFEPALGPLENGKA